MRVSSINWNFNWATAEEMQRFWAAIELGHTQVVAEILERNPKVMRWECNWKPLEVYARAKVPDESVLDLLMKHAFHALGSEPDPIPAACEAGNKPALLALLQRGFDPNGREYQRYFTPLHVTAERGQLELTQILLDAGANPNREDTEGRLPFEVATKAGHTELAELLRSKAAGKRIPCPNPRRPQGTAHLDITHEAPAIRKMFEQAATAVTSAEPITAVAVHGSGYEGFVEIGFHTGNFDINEADSAAEVSIPRVRRLEFQEWKNAFVPNQRLTIEYGGKKPWNKTTRAHAATMDDPFFRSFKGLLKEAMEAGIFDRLPLQEDCLFGVQMFLHHLADFWDRAGKTQGQIRT